MNPNEILSRLLDAYYQEDHSAMKAAAEELGQWMDKGGVPPVATSIEMSREVAYVLVGLVHSIDENEVDTVDEELPEEEEDSDE